MTLPPSTPLPYRFALGALCFGWPQLPLDITPNLCYLLVMTNWMRLADRLNGETNMTNNYPPGVTGYEPEIIGSDKEDWPWVGTMNHKGKLRFFWSDPMTNEPIGPFNSEWEAIEDIEKVRGGYFCCENCAQSFHEDREHGLVYGAEYFAASIRDNLCWYCQEERTT